MTDFNALPLELKRMIAKRMRQSDEVYRRRVGKPSPASREQSRGRGSAMLSLVNKEMRKICLKGLFSRIKSSRIRDEIFEYHILENHASFVTTFEFEGKMTLETISFIVLYILPRLPNLRRILISNHRFFAPFTDSQPATPDWNRSTFVWRKLLEIAKRIDKWQFCFSNQHEQRIESLLKARSQPIKTLAFNPAPEHFSLYIADSLLPPLLDLCPELRHLQLRICHPHPHLPQFQSIVHATALSRIYSFQKTLTVLDICCVAKGVAIPILMDSSILSFASLFPELLDFHVCGAHFELDPENPQTFSFPRLLRFEFGCWPIVSITTILKSLVMPRIKYIDCHFDDSSEFARDAHQNLPDLFALAHQIKTYSNTLQSLHLTAKFGLYSNSLSSFLDILSPRSYQVSTTWDQGDAECCVEVRGDEDESIVPSLEALLNGLTAGSKELIEWAKERIEETEETKDLSGARQMYKALKNVKDLRKWLRE